MDSNFSISYPTRFTDSVKRDLNVWGYKWSEDTQNTLSIGVLVEDVFYGWQVTPSMRNFLTPRVGFQKKSSSQFFGWVHVNGWIRSFFLVEIFLVLKMFLHLLFSSRLHRKFLNFLNFCEKFQNQNGNQNLCMFIEKFYNQKFVHSISFELQTIYLFLHGNVEKKYSL